MANQINRQAATIHNRGRDQISGFLISEIVDRYLWSVQTSSEQTLVGFSQAIFAEPMQFGDMLTQDSLRLIHLWPHQAYLLAEQPSLPESLHQFSSMFTDISHGICELSLIGDQALAFLDNHASVNLKNQQITETRNLRCLVGQYPVILWWDQGSDIRLLIDRSYAQSLCDYLNHLMQRWSQTSI